MDPITILSVGAGLAKAAYGFVQQGIGRQRARRNVRDEYEVPDEAYENVGMFEQLAQEGLPSNELEFMHQQALRGLSQSLSTGLQLGANANTVNDYYQSYLDKMTETGVRSAQARFSNINSLANSREALMREKVIKFGFDDAQWKDEAQLSTAEQTQGVNNIFGGFDDALGGVVSGENRKLYQKQIDANNRALGYNGGGDVHSGTDTGMIYGDGFGNQYQYGRVINSSTNPNAVQRPGVPGYVSNYLNGIGVGEKKVNNSNEYFWRKMSNDNLFWWTQPGEKKFKQ